MPPLDDLAALASAWRARAGESLSCSASHWCVGSHRRTSCGRCGVTLCLRPNAQVAAGTQRLGELLRLLAIAARGGPDVFRLLQEYYQACPFLDCAWCDDADDKVKLAVRVLNGGAEEPKILKQALFDWNESTAAVSDEFVALREALQAYVDRQPRSHAEQKVRVSLRLGSHSLKAPDILVYASHTHQLLQAISKTDSQTAEFRFHKVTYDATNVYVTPRELSPMLKAVLSYPIPVTLDPYYTRHMNITTLTEVCAQGSGASLQYLTEMTLQLDQAALEDETVMRAFCELLSTQCARLKRLTIDGSPRGDVEVQQRSLALLGAVLLAPRRLEYLSFDRVWLRDAQMESLVNAIVKSPHRATSSVKHLKILMPNMSEIVPLSVEELSTSRLWSWEELLRLLSSHSNLRKLTVSSIGQAYGQAENTEAADAQLLSNIERWPALTKLCTSYSSPTLMAMLLAKIGASIEEVSLSSTLPGSSIETLQAVMTHCPRVSELRLSDFEFDEALVETLAAACDNNCFTLRKLSIRQVNTTIAVPCVRLLQILSDPQRRLAQTLEDLYIYTTQQAFPVVRQATDLMLRCNARLVFIEIEQSQYSDEEDDDDESGSNDDDDNDSEDGGSDPEGDDRDDGAAADEAPASPTQTLLDEMAAAANGKTAIQRNEVLPDVVILPVDSAADGATERVGGARRAASDAAVRDGAHDGWSVRIAIVVGFLDSGKDLMQDSGRQTRLKTACCLPNAGQLYLVVRGRRFDAAVVALTE
ncbi:hypothetical protein PINS_up011547 [Pythium insidiosum]|nr:hypothetical protein PINS_up011547 [Pythium insidiosum]